MDRTGQKRSVLFVCLGNICRSPIAEAVFIDLLESKGLKDEWLVDSACTGDWQIGKPPDQRAIATMHKKDIGLSYKHKARQITLEDFHHFDVVFGMDQQNMSDLEGLRPKGSKAVLKMLGSYDSAGKVVIEDPFYGSRIEDFEEVCDQCIRCCEGYLKSLDADS